MHIPITILHFYAFIMHFMHIFLFYNFLLHNYKFWCIVCCSLQERKNKDKLLTGPRTAKLIKIHSGGFIK